jgi:ATPase family associated with various cellular activities (AAA)
MDRNDYLDRQYLIDRAMIKEVQLQTDRALRTLLETNLGEGDWPDTLANDGVKLIPGDFSQTAVAMILHAVAVEYGKISSSVLVPRTLPGMIRTGDGGIRGPEDQFDKSKRSVIELLRNGTTALIKKFSSSGYLTSSKTWGKDSALTLTWVYELLKADIIDKTNAVETQLAAKTRQRIEEKVEQVIIGLVNDPASVKLDLTSTDDYPVPHSFVLLRSLQLAKAVKSERWSELQSKLQSGQLPSVFLNQLHTELSNSAIQDGGFDPACLVFALEGLLMLNPDAITDSVVQQVTDTLGRTPYVGNHWQPVRPLVANKRGHTFILQTVEVVNSYLRICGLEQDKRRIATDPLFTRSFANLQSYVDWLLSRVVSVRVKTNSGEKECQGWQSEQTYKSDVVHLWTTSQIVLFMQAYSAMLQQHIAHEAGSAVNLDFRRAQKNSETAALSKWEGKKKDFEPLLEFEPASFLAYDRVDTLLVRPRATDASPDVSSSVKYSILLYGPPGTGKTTFCELLAAALRYDFIYVSPSDFIRAGESGVEERAKRVFDALLEQSNCVILLDEIDRLLLDRDSSEYARQGDMFQFMTPSMLTKINDLRQKKRSVFVIATNYAERIDSAIKRPGRIDEQILLLPPNQKRRVEIIKIVAKGADPAFTPEEMEEIARKTPLYIYKELEYIVESIKKAPPPRSEAIAGAVAEFGAPTISLESYNGRFHRQPQENAGEGRIDLVKTPWKEFALLAYLQDEASQSGIPEWAKSVLRDIYNNETFRKQLGDELSLWLKKYADKKT